MGGTCATRVTRGTIDFQEGDSLKLRAGNFGDDSFELRAGNFRDDSLGLRAWEYMI